MDGSPHLTQHRAWEQSEFTVDIPSVNLFLKVEYLAAVPFLGHEFLEKGPQRCLL